MAGTDDVQMQLQRMRKENEQLTRKIQQLEAEAQHRATATTATAAAAPSTAAPIAAAASSSPWSHHLTPRQISRYSRQLILSELGGADTQARLLRSRVLVVGAGGLGAPVCLYLAAAGVGHLTIVDGDSVELSNLHRQVIHTESRVGTPKALSAAQACRDLNSDVQVTPILDRFTEHNAVALARSCDVLVDASDNVATRYLINDVAMAMGKVLVSGSALRMEGQVCVFGLDRGKAPCYRCLYPKPPPPSSVTNCSDGGVLGAITGIIGSMQALEVIKILTMGNQQQQEAAAGGELPPNAILSATSTDFDPVAAASASLSTLSSKLLLLDGSSSTFRSVKLRARNPLCAVCGDHPSITLETLEAHSLDYQLFCGSANHDGPVAPAAAATAADSASAAGSATAPAKVPTVSVRKLQEALGIPLQPSHAPAAVSLDVSAPASSSSSATPAAPLLIDVREPVQFRICALPGAVNVPLRLLKQGFPMWLKQMLQGNAAAEATGQSEGESRVQSATPHPAADSSATPAQQPATAIAPRPIFVMCRRGVDSVSAARLIIAERDKGAATAAGAAQQQPSVHHVSGGLQAWNEQIDASFPLY